MAVRQFVLVGDSITHAGSPAKVSLIGMGGQGTWSELCAERLAEIPGVGPLMSAGFRGTWMVAGAAGSTEWSEAGSWTATVSTDAWDLAPYGDGVYSQAGSTAIRTWTRPVQWRPVVGFAPYFFDYTNGSTKVGGNWQYRVDGGTWTNMGQTLAHDNKLAKFYVPTSVTSTVDFRAYDGSGAVGCGLAGIEPFFLDPTSVTAGLIFHNLGRNGRSLDELVQSTSGDRMAFLDSVKVDGTHGGGAITNTANYGITMMHVNDIRLFGNTTTWAADIATFYSRVHTLAPLGYMSYGEMQAPTYDATLQASYRAQTKTSAALHSIPVYDFFDAWKSNGWGDVGTQDAALVAAGIITVSASPVDNGHPTQLGHFDMAPRAYWFIRNQILGLGAVETPFTAKGKEPAIQYKGKQPANQYGAGMPIGVA